MNIITRVYFSSAVKEMSTPRVVTRRTSANSKEKDVRIVHREAKEVNGSILREEIRQAERLCREEEEACSDAETLSDPDYIDEESSSDDSYESDFIDDTEVDEVESMKALQCVRRQRKFL